MTITTSVGSVDIDVPDEVLLTMKSQEVWARYLLPAFWRLQAEYYKSPPAPFDIDTKPEGASA